jgi:hypothetical protein
MTSRSWIRRLFNRKPRTIRKDLVRLRPRLEALEERTVPSAVVATTTSDLINDIILAEIGAGSPTIQLQAADATNGFDFMSAYLSTNDALPQIAANITISGTSGFDNTIQRDTASGTPAFRLFDVAAGHSLTLQNLTLAGGLAKGTDSAAEGGAIYSSGTLTLSDVTLQGNQAQGNSATNPAKSGANAGTGWSASGGGLYVAGGTVTLTNDTFNGNTALGGKGGHGGHGTAHFTANGVKVIPGGSGGSGGGASGGGLYVADGGIVTLTNVSFGPNGTFGGNTARGGAGGTGGAGGVVQHGTRNHPTNGVVIPGGTAGSGGAGSGGGLYVAGGTVTLNNDTVASNNAKGGAGGEGARAFTSGGTGADGGPAKGGGLDVEGGTITLNNDTFGSNNASGGQGGQGGLVSGLHLAHGGLPFTGGKGGGGANAMGGGLYVGAGGATLLNDTLSGNAAMGGGGGTGGTGQDRLTDKGGPGGDGGSGTGGGLYIAGGSTALTNTLIAVDAVTVGPGGQGGTGLYPGNSGAGGNPGSASDPDVRGTVTSSNDDLIGDGTGSNLSRGDPGGDLVGYTAAQLFLGHLANNGGPTSTMALLLGSPAIDAGNSAFFAPLPVPSGVSAAVQIGGYLLSASTTYSYRVSAFNLAGESLASTEVSTTGPAIGLISVALRWNAVPGATGYKVYGRTQGGELFLGTSPAVASPSFTDTGLIVPGSVPAPPIRVTTTDQRGFARISGSSVDIGAFELEQPQFNTTLPNGQFGSSYSQTIVTATGGASGPFTFTVSSGGLPPGLTLKPDGTLSGTPTQVGPFSFTILATDSDNDEGLAGVPVTVSQANAHPSVTAYSVTFDGNSHTASGNATDVNGIALPISDFTLTATMHTNAGTYSADAWSFHDPSGNYQDASGTVTDTISPENLTINAVTDSKTYDGGIFSSQTPTVVGAIYNNEVSPYQTFLSKDALGSGGSTLGVGYIISASGAGDYAITTNTATGTISPESLAINAVSDSKTYDGGTSSSQTPTLVGSIYNNEVTYSQAFQSKDALGSGGSTLVVSSSVSAGGTGDYAITTNTATGTISPESLTINAVSDSKTYNGGTTSSQTPTLVGSIYNNEVTYSQAFQSKNALGSGGSTLVVSYTVSAGGTGDYTITANTATGTISPATPTVQVTAAGGTYNQSAFHATASVAGVSGSFASSLENVTPTVTYYSGSTASGTPLAGAPVLPGTYTAKATFAGSTDYTSVSATTLPFTINPPTTSITGPTIGVPGQPLTDTFGVTYGPNGPTQGITFSINYGDGTSPLTTSAGGASVYLDHVYVYLYLDHVYTTTGSFTSQVTATDKNGVVSQLAKQTVTISTVAMEADSSGGTALAVGDAPAGGNTVYVTATDTTGKTLNVTVNGASFGNFTPTGHLFVYAQGGKDKITLRPFTVGNTNYYIRVPAFLYGEGSGGDKISAAGSMANNVLTGHGTNEVLTGGQGRDLLIGGTGAATLNAGIGDDILIGGWTNYDVSSSGMTYDQKLDALEAIMAEWGSTDSYSTRLNKLAGSLNNNTVPSLNTNTVHDNVANGVAVADTLNGNKNANDWFFAGSNDSVTGRNSNDVVTRIN